MKVFYCSTCFKCYYIHPQELTTVCWCTALFRCVLVYWCGSAGVGWYPNAGWSTTCTNLHTTLIQPNRTTTPVHTETEQYTHTQSSAPEDEFNNIRNMLSNKKLSWSDIKLVSLISTIKTMQGPVNIRFIK
jgi:hypothetical protein